MRESLKIIIQSLDLLHYCYKDFDYCVKDFKITPPARSFMKYSMESMIHHFKIYTEGFTNSLEEVYSVIEAPKGEFGIFLFSNDSNKL